MNNIKHVSLEDVKLFVEFMGWEQDDNNGDDIKDLLYYTPHNTEFQYSKLEEMQFHLAYHWIMEVVEKIVSTELYVYEFWYSGNTTKEWLCSFEVQTTIKAQSYGITTKGSKDPITAMYLACLNFIKWHNEENEKKLAESLVESN